MTDNEPIHEALAAIVHATASPGASWVVGGSAGLMLRGLPLAAEPRDLDIYCDDEDVALIYEALRQYAVDEPELSVTGMYRSRLCHFHIKGIQVELVGGFQVTADGCRYVTDVKNLLIPYGDVVSFGDGSREAAVVPLAHELWFNRLRGREDRVALIANAFAAAPGRHEEALEAIEAGNSFTAAAKSGVRRLIGLREAGDAR
ncbi:nucleotidyltransferase family protein [Paenibacillus arenilitoris]|uniref:Uncharacterized protein n=1 Tax=Paenibacillus arenilitoris TaxID=2772299 RepID=A0A927H663_9BACL|nr:hypothetical protein [Paenibacillus arenilitoris]MBD2869645.1 hypothetical protein [Paenibacillus arenilitoris]